MLRLKLIASVLALGLHSAWSADALTIDDSSLANNHLFDRFENDAGFLMADYDLSGVGRSSDGKWATLVSTNVFVSAFHFHPGTSTTVTFYQTNNPAGTSITRTVTGGQRIGTSDIWVGVLDNPVPVGYAVYAYATETINDASAFANSIYDEKSAFLIGRSPFGVYSGTQNFAVGRNVMDAWIDSVNVDGTIDDAVLTAIEGESEDVLYEATLVGGDSGAPLFVDLNELDNDFTLRLVGTNWFVGQVSPPPTDVNGFTYLGNYDAQIQAYIISQAVPEPSGAVALAIAGLVISTLRRRRA